MNALMKAVRTALEASGLWRDGAKLLCALSGGCDSVALVHALGRLRAQKALCVHAVHVQHGLRGEDSLADERFVRSLCTELNVPLIVVNANLTGDMHTPGMETQARERRRQIFEEQMKILHADALLTAHHLDDQAETVLMHLLRGSGMRGLCGMQTAVSFGGALLIRPFLSLPKQHLRAALSAENLPSREDGSNQEAVTPRNALRLQLLPELEKLFPNAGEHIAQTAEALAADEAYLAAEADKLYRMSRYAVAPLYMLRSQPLADAPEPIRRRVLRRWYLDGLQAACLQTQERSLSHEDTLALSALVCQPAGERLNLPCGLMAAREKDWLHLVHQSGQPLLAMQPYTRTICRERSRYELPHMILRLSDAAAIPSHPYSVILTPEWLGKRPVLRTPQPEDMIRPFGAPGRKPLRRYLTDRKVDPFLRRVWPVLCIQNEVLWCPGLCAAEALRLDHVPPGAVQLTIIGENPFIPKPPKE